MHIPVRIHPEWDFVTVRRAAVALAREVERRGEGLATAKWWKEERPPGSVFVDYNQNAKDHTVSSLYSVRPVADARVGCALEWDEVPDCEPGDFRIDTVPARLAAMGDPSWDIDAHPGSLDALLALADADEYERGLQDAPWPIHFVKQPGEPKRVQPSRAARTTTTDTSRVRPYPDVDDRTGCRPPSASCRRSGASPSSPSWPTAPTASTSSCATSTASPAGCSPPRCAASSATG